MKRRKTEENEAIRVAGMKNKELEWKHYRVLSTRTRYLRY